ncbi:hypothetical protein C9374_002199 [Naegleria lovaniensis]|uniref:Guanylate cyclase domain-containing protein n=1 Tax=Naegleria lovaniensis TaxID=51637 RepID=A0AA88KK72_NAELO|nr:uncharacterized protein C9374_002199 [Naegleria lovaniensis]KAG2386455.1 hypothetical protein C9374_002199 [Naegleria lovaniensis]
MSDGGHHQANHHDHEIDQFNAIESSSSIQQQHVHNSLSIENFQHQELKTEIPNVDNTNTTTWTENNNTKNNNNNNMVQHQTTTNTPSNHARNNSILENNKDHQEVKLSEKDAEPVPLHQEDPLLASRTITKQNFDEPIIQLYDDNALMAPREIKHDPKLTSDTSTHAAATAFKNQEENTSRTSNTQDLSNNNILAHATNHHGNNPEIFYPPSSTFPKRRHSLLKNIEMQHYDRTLIDAQSMNRLDEGTSFHKMQESPSNSYSHHHTELSNISKESQSSSSHLHKSIHHRNHVHQHSAAHNNTNGTISSASTSRRRPSFPNIKLIAPRRKAVGASVTSSVQLSDSSAEHSRENRKQLEQIFKGRRRDYGDSSCRGVVFDALEYLYNSVCPPNRICNLLILAIIIHTVVCIIATTSILYSAGSQSVQEYASLNNLNIIQKMVQFFNIATTASVELQRHFLLHSLFYNDTTGNGTFIEPLTRLTTTAIPKLYVHQDELNMILYGNGNGESALVQRQGALNLMYVTRNVLQYVPQYKGLITYPGNAHTIFNFYTDDLMQPVNTTPNDSKFIYDPRDRIWYTTVANSVKNTTKWSNVFVDLNTKLSISACIRLRNRNTIRPQFQEVLGVHILFSDIEKYFGSISSYSDYIMILIEKNGNILSTSLNNFPVVTTNGTRSNVMMFRNISTTNSFGVSNPDTISMLKTIAECLETEHIIGRTKTLNESEPYPCSAVNNDIVPIGNSTDGGYCYLTRWMTIRQFNTSQSFLVVTNIVDQHGMDFIFIISRRNYTFTEVLLEHFVYLLIVLVCTIAVGTALVLCLTSCISFSLWHVSKKLYHISGLRGNLSHEKSTFSKLQRVSNKIFYEIDILQRCIDNVERVNSSFVKYIPKSVVHNIVNGSSSGAKLGMVSAEITVMFTDLANFTNISENLSINNLLLVISRYFDVVTKNVQDCNGVIDKFIGDGVMALFNNPFQPAPNHAELACKAALQIVAELKKVNEEISRVYKMKLPYEITARVGLNTGACLVGNIGTHDRLNFTAVGDVVNISSRLESLNRMYGTTILIGEGTLLSFKGVENLRAETRDFFSSYLGQDNFSFSDLNQRVTALLESQVLEPAQGSAIPILDASTILMNENIQKAAVSQSSRSSLALDSNFPSMVCFFVDTICLKGKNNSVSVYALQCERKVATHDQLYIEKMLELIRRELLEEKRVRAVLKLLQNLLRYLEENQLYDSPLIGSHAPEFTFKFGDSTAERCEIDDEQDDNIPNTIIEAGDPYPVVYKFVSKIRDRLLKVVQTHESTKKSTRSNSVFSFTNRRRTSLLPNDSRSNSEPLVTPLLVASSEDTSNSFDHFASKTVSMSPNVSFEKSNTNLSESQENWNDPQKENITPTMKNGSIREPESRSDSVEKTEDSSLKVLSNILDSNMDTPHNKRSSIKVEDFFLKLNEK